MDIRATESEILELENKLLHPNAEPISLPLYFLRLITSDFSNEQELGRGGYGVVYKGLLRCGLVIAVKKIGGIRPVDDDQFQNEATFLMGIKHQNVVQLLGYCAESRGVMMTKLPNGKCVVAEEITRMLCFEYVCNKGLDKYLSDESSGLEWNTRYEIIKGICCGLNFLHEYNIVHLDLKPQNILLDANMMPKIADFGLSRLLGEQKSHTIIVTTNRAGTRGYMAPEYISRGLISTKADVFSLGVIIIEILKGCREYPSYNEITETNIKHFIEEVFDNWRNRFKRTPEYTALELHTQQVKQCINIALKCVHPDNKKRPNALEIIKILNAAERSSCLQNGEGSPIEREMGSQDGVPLDAQHEDEVAALIRSVLKDYTQSWIDADMLNKETSVSSVDMAKSVVALPQPQREPVLACTQRNEGSLTTLHYQGARNASFWVAHKVLASLADSSLKNWAATINLGPSVEALEREMKFVKASLESTLGKAIHNLAVEDILMDLRDLVHDAEDLVDEMEYFCIQDMLNGPALNVSPCSHLPYAHDDDDHEDDSNNDNNMHTSPKRRCTNEPMKLKFNWLNASQRMQDIVDQMKLVLPRIYDIIKSLGSNWCTIPNIAQSRPVTTSQSIEPTLYGRKLLMDSIIHDITKGKHSTGILTVIPIVGSGGIGKTTLAQHIYHSGEVQQHFDIRVWTCVSLNFHVNKLLEEIQRYIPNIEGESKNSTAGELIGQRLKNKRLLLVLDDIWDCRDADEWKQLLVPFQRSQVHGNLIIVTTRFPAQAQIMVQKNDHSIYLHGIESKEFMELFLEIIFDGDDQSRKNHTFLLETGFKIAGRLKGSPLAAKTVGRLLKTQLDLDHWTSVLESKEWEQSNSKNDIMPALRMSFDYLPSQLQLCFSYCALFPQDYKFKKEDLINFWIGLAILHPYHGENKRVEDIGLSHLTELVNYGFLEKKEKKDGIPYYTIHDLLHELGQKVSSHECLSIDNYQSRVSSLKVLPSIRHLSINIDDACVKDRLTLKGCVEDFNTLHTRLRVIKLHTLMIFGEHHGCLLKVFGDLFREAKALRVIFLSEATYDVEYLLCNFYNLLHLRYLRIETSYPYKVRVPNQVCRFYHMMVLDVKYHDGIIGLPKHNHQGIIDLPKDINNLVKLRHFLVQNDATHSSIAEVGKLKSMQELRSFRVKKESQGFELREIGNLTDLCGTLSIYNLEKVQVKEEADKAKLLSKVHLHELILHWDNGNRSTNDSTLEEHVLERLKPTNNLLKLSIEGHRGTACPLWLGENLWVKNLESLCLQAVSWKTFPPLGEFWLVNEPHRETISRNIPDKRFQNLRRLKLYCLLMVGRWEVHAPCQLFPFLEELMICNCPQLVELLFSHSATCCQQGKEAKLNLFPRLSKLDIENCPQLLSFPPVPWTEAPCSITINRIGSSFLDKLICGERFNSGWSLEIVLKKDVLLPLSTLENLNHGGNVLSNTVTNITTTIRTWWNVLAFHNLTRLKELDMSKCQPLPLRCLQILSSLRTLSMSCSNEAFPFVEADSLVNYQLPVESLIIYEWNASGKELTQLLTYFPKVSDLTLLKCVKVTGLGVNMRGQQAMETPGPSSSSSSLMTESRCFCLPKCRCDLLLLPPQLQKLKIRNCPELNLRSNSNPHNESSEDGPTGGGGIQGLSSLRHLTTWGCPMLLSTCSSSLSIEKAYSSSSFTFPNSLEYIDIIDVVSIKETVPLSNLTSLTSLSLLFCRDLRGEGLVSLLSQGHLTKLSITGTPDFFLDSEPSQSEVHEQEIPSHPSKLQKLLIDDVAGFTAAAIHHGLLFSSLATLDICGDDNVDRFTEEQEDILFVNSLKKIEFVNCENLQYLPARLQTLPNLKSLQIDSCEAIQILPEYVLPCSLQYLSIDHCHEIRSLPKDCLPSSLQTLVIWGCPAIHSLPEVDDLPGSLREIDVSSCGSDELKRHCRKLIGIIPIVRT